MIEHENKLDATLADELIVPDSAGLAEAHPADVADHIETLPPEEGADVLEAMPAEHAAEALQEMDEEDAHVYLEDMEPDVAAKFVYLMALDDAADVLAETDDAHRAEIMAFLPPAHRAELAGLMEYPPESAGGMMSPEVAALPANLTKLEAIAELQRLASELEQIYYTYVVDHQHRLVGVLSLRDLILAPETRMLHEIMREQIVSVPALMDREEVAATFSKYGFYALPVVAEDGVLLGNITVDDVVEVIQDEATEDMQMMVGAGADERVDSPLGMTMRHRLPWLAVNLCTGVVVASVLGLFEQQLGRMIELIILAPMVAGLAGNTGQQSLAVVIRGIATGETRGLGAYRLLRRNALVGLCNGAVIGLIAATGCLILWRDVRVAMVLGTAMWLCMIVAAVSGALVPWAMKRLGFDPAQSSSIILTAITDVVGFGLFLALGVWLVLKAA